MPDLALPFIYDFTSGEHEKAKILACLIEVLKLFEPFSGAGIVFISP